MLIEFGKDEDDGNPQSIRDDDDDMSNINEHKCPRGRYWMQQLLLARNVEHKENSLNTT